MGIVSSLVQEFKNLYYTISKATRRVFRYLHWMTNNLPTVFPSIDHIAEQCGCSISTVKRATAQLQKWGWLVKIKRGYQSNLYCMNSEISSLDIDNPNTFKKNFPEKRADNELVLKSVAEYIDTSSMEVSISSDIPYCIQIQGLNREEQAKLAKSFSERVLLEALDNVKWYARQGNKIKSHFAVMWTQAKKIACRYK